MSRHHHLPSVSGLLSRSCNMTSTDPVIVWQTRGQRKRRDYATEKNYATERDGATKRVDHATNKRSKSRERTLQDKGDRLRWRDDWKRRHDDRIERRSDKYQEEEAVTMEQVHCNRTLNRQEFEYSFSKKRTNSFKRTMNCSRMKQRSRSRSPRHTAKTGHGILKRGRSATHDGRKRVSIARFDQVVEFESWPRESGKVVEGNLTEGRLRENDNGTGFYKQLHSVKNVDKNDAITSVINNKRPLLHVDPTLPVGWSRELIRSGNRWKVVITGPNGRRFWSKSDLKKADKNGVMGGLEIGDFNFSVFGLKGKQ